MEPANVRLAMAGDLVYEAGVSYKGTVKNGVVVLPPEAKLPEGTEVEVIAEMELLPEDDPFIAAVLKLAKPRPHWPKDYALNHAHYVKGHPRKS